MPNSSSTVHSATGRTILSVFADLGRFEDVPNAETHMKGYSGLSHVKDADSLLTAQPFLTKTLRAGATAIPNFTAEGALK